MPKFNINLGLVVALALQTTAVAIYRDRITTLVEMHNQLIEEHNSMAEQMAYMCELLNKNDIELDEFDLIALPSVTKQS